MIFEQWLIVGRVFQGPLTLPIFPSVRNLDPLLLMLCQPSLLRHISFAISREFHRDYGRVPTDYSCQKLRLLNLKLGDRFVETYSNHLSIDCKLQCRNMISEMHGQFTHSLH
jgi:hypothetical protein